MATNGTPEYKRAWYLKNRERMLMRSHANYQANREKRIVQAREYDKAHPEIKEYRRVWGQKRHKERYQSDIVYRLECSLRARFRNAIIKNKDIQKAPKAVVVIGCDSDGLRQYLEGRFLPGMTWENYGKGVGCWEIDHIRPCASFDLMDPAQREICFHYSNLQPLWIKDNRKKSNTWGLPHA